MTYQPVIKGQFLVYKTDGGHYEGIYSHLIVDDYFDDFFQLEKKDYSLNICARNTERKFSHSETCAFSNLSLKRFSVKTRQNQANVDFFSLQKTKKVC